jgi:hypothetical protein
VSSHRGVALAVVVGSVLFFLSCSLPNVGLFDEDRIGDTPLYHRYGTEFLDGKLPYRDFYMEYPPGALPVFVLPELGDAAGYTTRFKLLLCLLGLLAVALVAVALRGSEAGPRRLLAATAFVGLAPAALGPVFLVNFDLWPALLTIVAVTALVLGRERLGLGALALGVAAKVYPVVLLPIALMLVKHRSGTRAAWIAGGVFAGTLVVVALPFFLLAPGGFGYSLSVAFRRPLQIESLGASILQAAHQLGVYDPGVNSRYNSQNLDGSLPQGVAAISLLVGTIALLAVWIAFARRPTADRFVLAAAAAVTAFVAFGKILSPQYLVWLVPLVALLPRRAVAASTLLGAALVLTQLWFPSRYGDVVALEPVTWLVLARNLVLVALFAVLASTLRADETRAQS